MASRALPSRALILIREYSRPITRPDWRQSKPIITTYKLHFHVFKQLEVEKEKIKRRLLIAIQINIHKTEWYWTWKTIKNNGLENYYIKYFYKYGVKFDHSINIRDMDGINSAIEYHTFMLISNCMSLNKFPHNKLFGF